MEQQRPKVIPDALPGMVAVSRDAFYAVVGKLDVHPTPQGPWDHVLGYRSDWKLRDGRLIACSIGEPPLSEVTYMVTEGFHAANRAALSRTTGEGQ